MSTLIVLAIVAVLVVSVMIVFTAVVIGIHSEPRRQMNVEARGPLAAIARRLLGVHVANPASPTAEDNRAGCLTGNTTDRHVD